MEADLRTVCISHTLSAVAGCCVHAASCENTHALPAIAPHSNHFAFQCWLCCCDHKASNASRLSPFLDSAISRFTSLLSFDQQMLLVNEVLHHIVQGCKTDCSVLSLGHDAAAANRCRLVLPRSTSMC